MTSPEVGTQVTSDHSVLGHTSDPGVPERTVIPSELRSDTSDTSGRTETPYGPRTQTSPHGPRTPKFPVRLRHRPDLGPKHPCLNIGPWHSWSDRDSTQVTTPTSKVRGRGYHSHGEEHDETRPKLLTVSITL